MFYCFLGQQAQLQQDPNDPTKWQVVPTNVPTPSTPISSLSPTQPHTIIEQVNPGRRLRRVACTCHNCRDIEGRQVLTSNKKYPRLEFNAVMSAKKHLSLLKSLGTVLTFNSCTKCVGSPGNIHSSTPDCHPSFPEHGCRHWSMTSPLKVALIRSLRGSLMCLAYCFNKLPMAVCTTRHWQTSSRPMQELNVWTVALKQLDGAPHLHSTTVFFSHSSLIQIG